MTHLTVAFHNFENAPNKNNYTENVEKYNRVGWGGQQTDWHAGICTFQAELENTKSSWCEKDDCYHVTDINRVHFEMICRNKALQASN